MIALFFWNKSIKPTKEKIIKGNAKSGCQNKKNIEAKIIANKGMYLE